MSKFDWPKRSKGKIECKGLYHCQNVTSDLCIKDKLSSLYLQCLLSTFFFPTTFIFTVGYKSHTDCIEDNEDKRDRVATVLVYLDTVTEGGETKFPGLNYS